MNRSETLLINIGVDCHYTRKGNDKPAFGLPYFPHQSARAFHINDPEYTYLQHKGWVKHHNSRIVGTHNSVVWVVCSMTKAGWEEFRRIKRRTNVPNTSAESGR